MFVWVTKFKGLVAGCHSICLFFVFITYSTDIHSITFIQSTYPSPFAGASLHGAAWLSNGAAWLSYGAAWLSYGVPWLSLWRVGLL
jgi:hypothetical protein